MIGICSHVIAVTAFSDDEDGYDIEYLQRLVEGLGTKKRKSHRPHQVVGGAHIQPSGDSTDEEYEEDEAAPSDLDEL